MTKKKFDFAFLAQKAKKANLFFLMDSDDESSSDESLDHGGDMGTPVPPAVDAVAPAPAPERPQTPPRPASPVAPPRPPSPIGIGARLFRCVSN